MTLLSAPDIDGISPCSNSTHLIPAFRRGNKKACSKSKMGRVFATTGNSLTHGSKHSEFTVWSRAIGRALQTGFDGVSRIGRGGRGRKDLFDQKVAFAICPR